MDIALWIVAGLLAIGFLGSGVVKLARPREALVTYGLAWVEEFSDRSVKTIGVLEVLAAVGLILPAALDILPVLVPLAGAGLVLLMIGAIGTHVRRREPQGIAVSLILLALAAFLTWGRFGPESFTS